MNAYLYRCPRCKRTARSLFDGNAPPQACQCSPGRAIFPRRIIGHVGSSCPCDRRCTHAVGPDCDCQCGGLNHGIAYACTSFEPVDSGLFAEVA